MSEDVRQNQSTTVGGLALTPRAVVGLFIALLGIVLTLDRLHIINANALQPFWPLALVAVGFARYMQDRGRGGHSGLILMAVGGWIFLNTIGFTRIRIWELFWPVVLILIGVSLVRQTLRGGDDRSRWSRSWGAPSANATGGTTSTPGGPNAEPNERLNSFAFMSGVRRASNASRFLGGDIFAFMGSTNLDLRLATIPPGEEASIEVFAMMSGTEIRVPPSWTVVTPLVPVMGGIEDKRLPPLATAPPAAGAPAAPRLVLRGFILMSGIQIKN